MKRTLSQCCGGSREINVWQLEWDGERSTTCRAVNLSGKAELLVQSHIATTAEFVKRQEECDYKHWPWFPITSSRQFDRPPFSTGEETTVTGSRKRFFLLLFAQTKVNSSPCAGKQQMDIASHHNKQRNNSNLYVWSVIIHQKQRLSFISPGHDNWRRQKISYYLVSHILLFHKAVGQYAQVWGLVFNLELFSQVMGVICFPRQVAICI